MVDLEKDVQLINVKGKFIDELLPVSGQAVYLISGVFEGMGQITKTLIFITTDEAKAKKYLLVKDQEEDGPFDRFAYYKYEVLIVGDTSFISRK